MQTEYFYSNVVFNDNRVFHCKLNISILISSSISFLVKIMPRKQYNINDDGDMFKRASRYSVVQSDGNSFCGDVVSDSIDKTSRDEDNILDKTYDSN